MARLRVNLAEGEFEVEGSEEFVEAWSARVEALLDHLSRPDDVAAEEEPVAPPARAEGEADAPFGGLMQALPRNATDVDRMLLAGLFLQRRSAERTFTTADANRLLLEHGLKLGNPSQSVKQNLVAKRAFSVQRGRYRVAQSGLTHLEQLTAGIVREG